MPTEYVMYFFLYCRVNQYSEQKKTKFYETVIRPVAKEGAAIWALNKDIAI